MSKELPDRPNLEHLRGQAKKLLTGFRTGSSESLDRVSRFLPNFSGGRYQLIALHDAQLVIAREYGFPSWPRMVAFVEESDARVGITKEVADSFVNAAVSDNVAKVERLLQLYPGLPTFNETTALVAGELDTVGALVASDSGFVFRSLAPLNWKPIEYVCYSRMGDHSRYDGLWGCARALLDAGADPNTYHLWGEDENARLPVLFGAAAESGHAGIVRLLLERGAHPNDGESVYHAAERNRREVLDTLLEFKADLSSSHEYWDNTPLFFLCGYRPSDPGYENVVAGIEWLLDHGADPNVACRRSNGTPLHAASRQGGTAVVDMLLARGANPGVKNSEGRTPYELALLTGNLYAARSIEHAGGGHELIEPVELLAACASGDGAKAERMLKANPGLPALIGERAGWVICKLAEFGVAEGVETMIKAGFSPALKGEAGGTPLHYACFCGHLPVVSVLLRHKAPFDVRDSDYDATPLGWALHAYRHHRATSGDYPGIIRALLEAGAAREEVEQVLGEWEEFEGVLGP